MGRFGSGYGILEVPVNAALNLRFHKSWCQLFTSLSVTYFLRKFNCFRLLDIVSLEKEEIERWVISRKKLNKEASNTIDSPRNFS